MNSNNPQAKARYTKYCKILSKVTEEAKKQHISGLRAKSNNKIKTTWNIINKETGHSVEVSPP
jgi:hypothetical protein